MASAALGRALALAALLSAVGFVAYVDARRGEAAAPAWKVLRPSPLARTEVGAARIGDRIYLVGGFVPEGGSTAEVARYDISADRWRRVAPLPIAVNHPGVAALGGRVYVLGGDAEGSGRSDALFAYSPAGDRWRRLDEAPVARAALGLVGAHGRLYAVGGVGPSGDLRRLDVYDVERHRWRQGAPMPTPRNHLAAAHMQGRIYAVGGRGSVDGQTVNLDVVESYGRARRARETAMRRWTVRYLPEALAEKDAIKDSAEVKAIDRAADKLQSLGPDLREPHQRHIEGSREGLRELRPRAGRSRWRPIYWRAGGDTFVIGALAPEVETDKRGYRRGVRHAEERKLRLDAAEVEA